LSNISELFCDFDNPALDFVKIAQGMGVHAVLATTADEFNQQFKSALAHQGPNLIEVLRV